MTNFPLISVIMSTYNRSDLIPKALDSILNQTYPNMEIIIIDDCSPDDTASVIAAYQEKTNNIIYHRLEQNIGPGGARNFGIQQAHGVYVAIMDDDDECVPDRLMIQYQYMAANPDVGVCFGLAKWVNMDGSLIGYMPNQLARGEYPSTRDAAFELNYLQLSKLPNPSVMAKRSIMLQYPFAEDVRVGEDWYAYLTMMAQDVPIHGIQEVLVIMARDNSRDGLMRSEHVVDDQLKVINRVAREQSLPEYLHKRALSNHYIRMARASQWTRRPPLVIRALSLWFRNPMAWRTVTDLFALGFGRVRRLITK